ncbi:ATP-binding protein [Halomonas sp. KM-1]|uniref:ATP-binding protein n=1 Tax=Halomonas sp. KM-1 TaxID=590061 RepID=UPI0002F48D2C|nr:ATP-binding protein [Halomonas sp. KM-1]
MSKLQRYLQRLRKVRLNVLIALLVAAMVGLALAVSMWLFVAQQRSALEQASEARVMDLARVVAGTEPVRAALEGGATGELQREIDTLRRELEVDFIVVMDERSRRLTHPDASQLGLPFEGGDETLALQGERYASRAEGTLGTSIRGFAPVRGEDERVIGAVAVGVTLATLLPTLEEHRRHILLGMLALSLLAGLAVAGLSRYLKRVLLGLEPHQIARLVEERQALLSSVHEGILAVDGDGRITLANTAAHRLLGRAGLSPPEPGKMLADYLPQIGMLDVLAQGTAILDAQVTVNEQRLLVNSVPVHHDGRLIGAVATFRDKDEVERLAEELTGVRRYAEALRASSHDFKNTLHVVTGLARLGDLAALRRYLRELNDGPLLATMLGDRVRDPVLAGYLLGKRSEAEERGIAMRVAAETPIPVLADSALGHTLVTVLGNLLENAFEAVSGSESASVSVLLAVEESVLIVEVQDTGPGIEAALLPHIFESGVTTKGEQRGVGLALAKARLEAQGGSLALYSQPGQGTLAEVSLPLSEQERAGEWS